MYIAKAPLYLLNDLDLRLQGAFPVAWLLCWVLQSLITFYSFGQSNYSERYLFEAIGGNQGLGTSEIYEVLSRCCWLYFG